MIQELIFQGIFHMRTPVRLEFKEPYVSLKVPSSLDAEQIKLVLTTLFYPKRLTAEQREQAHFGQEIKIAVVFDVAEHVWRILRRDDDDSLRLQVKEASGYRDVATGLDVPRLLQEKLRFAPYPLFSALNLWRLDQPLPKEVQEVSVAGLDEKTRVLVGKYRDALQIEGLEDDIRGTQELRETKRQRLGEGAKLEDNLERARAKLKEIDISSLSKDDLELLNERDARLSGFSQQITRLGAEEEQSREELNAWLPDKPWRHQLFWVGVVLTVAAAVTSVVLRDTLRPLAAVNVLGLGMSAWIVLRYFTDMERASVHVVRLDSIKRRLTQVREEQVAFRERIGHLLIHAGVEDENELLERFEKSNKLRTIVGRMQEQFDKLNARPVYQQAKREIASLDEELAQLQERRLALGNVNFTAYQLESDLIKLGVDPEQALSNFESEPREEQLPDYERDVFSRLAELARRSGLMSDSGRLAPPVLTMWSKICGHVMGQRFTDINMSGKGDLEIAGLAGEQLEMWSRTRPRELNAVAMGLGVALLINLPGKLMGPNTILLPDLTHELSAEHAQKMQEVLKSAARKTRIVVCS